MHRSGSHWTAALAGIAVAGLLGFGATNPLPANAQEDELDLSQYFGFGKLEIYKLQRRSANMLVGDMNHDGHNDLIVVDNSHSRIDLLQQRLEKVDTSKSTDGEPAVNEVGSDWRFEHRKIPVDKKIISLTLGDFNNDGRTDIAYVGSPDRLVIRHQRESGDWTSRTSFRIPKVATDSHNLAAGDLNHDGKDDLVVLGTNQTYVIFQQPDGEMAVPHKLMNTSEKLSGVRISDLDGNGRNDLCYLARVGNEDWLCARLQNEDAQLGPELQFDLKGPRSGSVVLANVDGETGDEVLTVDSQSGRVKLWRLRSPESKPGEPAGRLYQYGFGRSGSDKDRDLATGDLDGDGATDVVVTDPESAQVIVFRQHPQQGLDLGTPYPGLLGASQIRTADFDGDKSAEVVVLSAREKTIGVCGLKDGRLTFPQSLEIVDEPAALELADLNADGRDEVVYISKKGSGRSAKYTLRALQRVDDGDWQPLAFGESESVPLKLQGTPSKMLRLDADHDGRPDFLVFSDLGREPLLLKTSAEGIPQVVDTRGGISFGKVSAGAVFVGQLDEPVLLAAQKTFARNLQLDERNRWRVIDQYNAAESNARIAGVATINFDGEAGNEIVLFDTGIQKLRVLRWNENIFRPWREIEMGSFPYKSTRVADLNSDGHEDLLLFGRGKFAVLYAGRADPVLEEVASFETKLKNTYFGTIGAGDLNEDGHTNVAVIDTRSHYIEFLDVDDQQSFRHILHFKLFEGKGFSRNQSNRPEPREVVIADVTSDGRNDLILLSHDRVLVFPQDDGK